MLERVYLYKTAHHSRLETDYKELALDAAMATAGRADIPESRISPARPSNWSMEAFGANNPIGVGGGWRLWDCWAGQPIG